MAKNKQVVMNFTDWLRKKTFGMLGLVDTQQLPNSPSHTDFLINDPQGVRNLKLKEYNVWYAGDSDELLNFYTRNNMVEYNYEPYYDRNKQSYFWSISSTEGDIKRTHSGQPRNIVDTLVNIVGLPKIQYTSPADGYTDSVDINKKLQKILDNNNFTKLFLQEQLPLTLVEGWGCLKINYDTTLSDTPILLYYRAEACQFIYKQNVLCACVFKDYYMDEHDQRYVLIETRRKSKTLEKITVPGSSEVRHKYYPCLIIEKELFIVGADGETLTPASNGLKTLPQLEDVEPALMIRNYDGFLAQPCVIYQDSTDENQGRSIFTGKIDLFDDLDQCLSQASNTVRRSTVKEYFNSNYLERDPATGLPIMPTAYDRKYVMFQGGRDANGSTGLSEPVQVTQPAVNFNQYDAECSAILMQIINGIMSPATLGIDLARRDNAVAQREKEKVTIFTRNTIIAEEEHIWSNVCRELLCAQELMDKGEITAKDYEFSVKFNEFADASFESKVDVLLTLYNAGTITPELFIEKLYGDMLSPTDKQKQVDYINSAREETQQMADEAGGDPYVMGGFGALGASNAYNDAMQNPENAVQAPGLADLVNGFGRN